MPISNSTDRFNGVIASLAVKVRAVVAAETNVAALTGITNPYSGINIVDGDRILLVAQTDATENGAWDVSDNDVWTRAFDWDGNRDVEKGSTIWAGQAGGLDKLWQVATDGVIIPGSTAVSIIELLDPLTLPGGQPNPIILPEIAGAGPDVPGEGQIWVRDDGPNVLMFTDDLGNDFVVSMSSGDMQTPWLSNIDGDGFDLNDAGVIFMREQASANADVSNQGQFWVRNTLDGEPMFTDDQGVDTVLNTGGGGGGTPAGANEEIQYNDNGAFGASPRLRWDASEGSLDIDARDATARDGAVYVTRIQEAAIGLRIDSINGNTTFHEIWRSTDSGGESSWHLDDDHTGGTRLLHWDDDFSDTFLEFEAGGKFRIGGHDGTEKVFIDFDTEEVAIRNGATLYFEELASANPEVLGHAQVWVRSDTPNTLMFTDDAGTDFVIGGALGPVAEVNDLTAVVTWANVPDANITVGSVTQHVASIDHDGLLNFVAAEHIDWSVTGAEDVHTDRIPVATTTAVGGSELATTAERITGTDAARTLTPATAQKFVMVTPVSIALGADDVWETISDAALATAGATHALIKCFAQIAPTGTTFATQVIHLRETGSAIAKATSNRAVIAGEEDSAGIGTTTDTNDAWVELDANQDFDILQDQVSTGTSIAQAWIVGYMA